MIPPRPRDEIELTTRDLRKNLEPADSVKRDVRVIVGITAHGAERDLSRCLASVAMQRIEGEAPGILVLLDRVGSAGAVRIDLPEPLRDRAWVLTGNCGSPARARNTILEFVDREIPSAQWVARLDWDDRFASEDSLAAAVVSGDRAGARFVLGGNRVLARAGSVLRDNPARADLLLEDTVLERLRGMSDGTGSNELPSCNLLLAARSGIRYPDTGSAEDHWLVADLLINRASEGAVVESPLFADYTLDGDVTGSAKGSDRYRSVRRALFVAARTWVSAKRLPGRVLGLGQEGIVREHAGTVYKHFYPGTLSDSKVAWLGRALRETPHIPSPQFRRDEATGSWIASYPWEETSPVERLGEPPVRDFLKNCLDHRLVCGNIKRSNFRVRRSGELLYVDIGNWVVPMDVSILRDSAARLYSIGVLNWSDEEVLRRRADYDQPEIWTRLPGFAEFFGDTVAARIRAQWASTCPLRHPAPPRERGVSLLIKACAMDAAHAREQIIHLVSQLVGPRDFAERVLLIDQHPGPFPRAHAPGDLDELRTIATELQNGGVIDRVLLAPLDPDCSAAVNRRWFGVECRASHSKDGVPVAPQLWAFEQVQTRFVLQCDIDALVGRRDPEHDYLGEMLEACRAHDALGIAFNIPHDPSRGFRAYAAPPGEYKPEVRCGLLDLERIRAVCPLPNSLEDDRLARTWYQSLHEQQRRLERKTLRGGHSSTFYVHPPNSRKKDLDALSRIRDLVSQGIVPPSQFGRWDLEAPDKDWLYPPRAERLVFLARGRDTTREKVERFSASLAMQDEQRFGLVVIDDASKRHRPQELQEPLRWIGERMTLVRHARQRGRMRNSVLAIREVCTNPDTLVAYVDLDDALADRSVATRLHELADQGHDVVLAAPFRPDAPTKVYRPSFDRPRETYGGDVWIHLRAFRKRLFDLLPDEALQLDGEWLMQCDDYAIMIPLVELARKPIYVPEYFYFHERFTEFDEEGRRRRDEIIEKILAKPRPSNVER